MTKIPGWICVTDENGRPLHLRAQSVMAVAECGDPAWISRLCGLLIEDQETAGEVMALIAEAERQAPATIIETKVTPTPWFFQEIGAQMASERYTALLDKLANEDDEKDDEGTGADGPTPVPAPEG